MDGVVWKTEYFLINHVHPIRMKHGKALMHDGCMLMEMWFSSDNVAHTVWSAVVLLSLIDLDYSEDFAMLLHGVVNSSPIIRIVRSG